MNQFRRIVLASLAVILGVATAQAQAHAQEQTVRVAMARALASAATLIALEKGYFKDAGIKVEVDDIDTAGNAMALLAQNKIQIIEGGISAGYFNALEKELPITIATDRVTTPINHKLLVRADLKDTIKKIADLKGKVIASNGAGSITNYEVGKILESGGVNVKDIEFKILPFPQMAIAFANKAIDAALVISPWNSQIVEKELAFIFADPDDYVKPTPLTIAVSFINTEWEKQNPELVSKYIHAYMRGVRDYCQAYHGGPNRQEVIDILIKTGAERRPEVLDKFPWPARNVSGRLNVDSLLDVQAWYAESGLTQKKFPAERLVNFAHVDQAAKKLGSFEIAKKDSKLRGCR